MKTRVGEREKRIGEAIEGKRTTDLLVLVVEEDAAALCALVDGEDDL